MTLHNYFIYTQYIYKYIIWNHKCDNESDAVRKSVHVRELCDWRDKYDCICVDKIECKTTMDILCKI